MSLDTQFELIDSESGLLALEPEWRKLFDEAGKPSPFLDFDWVLMCWRRMTIDGPHRPFIATVREAGRLVLAIPMQRQRYRLVFWRYYGLETKLPQYNDGLVAPGGSTQDWVAALQRGLGGSSLASILVLNRLPNRSPLFGALVNFARPAELTSVSAVELSAGYDAYLSSFSGPTRNQMRRMQKHLAKTGHVECRNATAQTFTEDFAWLLQNKRSWTPPKGRELRRFLLLPDYERDLSEIGRKWIETGQMTLGTIEAGGHRVAAGMVLNAGAEAIFYITTYSREYAAVSPGRMLALWLIDQAARSGCVFFDFMAGWWGWKDRLKTGDYAQCRLKLPLKRIGQ